MSVKLTVGVFFLIAACLIGCDNHSNVEVDTPAFAYVCVESQIEDIVHSYANPAYLQMQSLTVQQQQQLQVIRQSHASNLEESELGFLLSDSQLAGFLSASTALFGSHPELLEMSDEELESFLAPMVLNALFNPDARTPVGDCSVEKADYAQSMVMTIAAAVSGNIIAWGIAVINMGIRGEALADCMGH